MRSSISRITVALLVGLVMGVLLAGGSLYVAGQGSSEGQLRSMSFGNHHQHQTFTLGPGQSRLLQLPRVQTPVILVLGNSLGSVSPLSGVRIDPATGNIINAGNPVGWAYQDDNTHLNDNGGPNGEPVVENLTADQTITYELSIWY